MRSISPFDLVPGERIVYAYDRVVGEARISASLVTVTFAPAGRSGARTRMTFTEQVVFVDGHGDADDRRAGTEVGLDWLRAEVEPPRPPARAR